MNILKNKITVVTGAGSGIGKAIATLFAAEGAKVILTDVHQQNIEAVAAAISAEAGTAVCFAADISKEADVNLLFNFAEKKFGALDILVNNAGVMDNFTPVADLTNKEWERVIGINLTGPFYTSRRVMPSFLRNGKGVIINIASIGGLFGGRAGLAYTASKHGLIGLTKNIAYQYAEKGIRCNAIAPGGVNTNISYGMNPNPFGFERMEAGTANMPPAANPDDIAGLALYLASDQAKFINGAVVTADGGWTAY